MKDLQKIMLLIIDVENALKAGDIARIMLKLRDQMAIFPQEIKKIAIGRANENLQNALKQYGFDYIPNAHCGEKNSADRQIYAKVRQYIPSLDMCILVSNDSDFAPLLKMLKAHHIRVITLCVQESVCKILQTLSDVHFHIFKPKLTPLKLNSIRLKNTNALGGKK
ncbi:NYN domain-containing protein [Helicobacter sp. MIT 05-5293]|uniref:NYN domain-containing protein n=1 Tax=Helicobacter sp. MIT 05-5293 TaxID=1548149 RepID=UPI00051D7DD2|nr:NYN domain-containing protein [Helicobacter sp. MIT 05-5293]